MWNQVHFLARQLWNTLLGSDSPYVNTQPQCWASTILLCLRGATFGENPNIMFVLYSRCGLYFRASAAGQVCTFSLALLTLKASLLPGHCPHAWSGQLVIGGAAVPSQGEAKCRAGSGLAAGCGQTAECRGPVHVAAVASQARGQLLHTAVLSQLLCCSW